MLFINFLCLLYLMVLSNGHTISKSIDNDERIDDVSDGITTLNHIRHHRVRHDKFNHTNKKGKKITQPLDVSGKTKLTLKPPKSNAKTTEKPTSDYVTYKSQQRKGGFWRKLKGKDKKPKYNDECKYSEVRERKVPEAREYGWWKQAERMEIPDSNLRSENKRKYRNSFVLRPPKSSYIMKDIGNLRDGTGQKNVNDLQMITAPQMFTMSTPNVRASWKADTPKFSGDINSMLSNMTTHIENLMRKYGVDSNYSSFVSFYKVLNDRADLRPHYSGTAHIEELLNSIKVKTLGRVAENNSSVIDIISTTVTQSTFEADPLLSHNEVFTPGYFTDDWNNMQTKDASFEYDANDSVMTDESNPHHLATRSLRDDTITLAQGVEELIQREIKNIYQKVRGKVVYNITDEVKKITSSIKTTTKKFLDKVTKANEPKKSSDANLESPLWSPMEQSSSLAKRTTASRFLRGGAHSINTNSTKTTITPTPTYDDYLMLTLYEKILEKTHQNNVMKMFATADLPVKKYSYRLSKRNSDILADKQLSENVGKLYDDIVTMPDYAYEDRSVSTKTSPGSSTATTSIPTSVLSATDGSEPSSTYSSDQTCTQTDNATMSSDLDDSSYEGLSNKISYNNYVNGYKHYLNFQKEQGQQNFSAMVKYQAHRHHNVNDIGKYILDKIPQLPAQINELWREKRFSDDTVIDDTDIIDDQDVSTKSEESWFKKHFYLFIDNGPLKKYHTSQTVALKSPVANEGFVKPPKLNDRKPLGPGPNDHFFIQIGDDSGDNENVSDDTAEGEEPAPEVNLEELSNLLEKLRIRMNKQQLHNDNPMGISNAPAKITASNIKSSLTRSLSKKKMGGKRRSRRLTSRRKRASDDEISQDFITRDLKDKPTTAMRRAVIVTSPKHKEKIKLGYVDINLIPKQSVVRENSTKKNKFREFFNKFNFKHKETKRKDKRSCSRRPPRFNPFKKIKDMFKGKPNITKVLSKPKQNVSDNEIANSHIETFKPVKYDKVMTPQDMQMQVPNISDVTGMVEDDINASVEPRHDAYKYTMGTTFNPLLFKLDDNEEVPYEKKPPISPPNSSGTTSIFQVLPSIKENDDLMAINVRTLKPNPMKPKYKSTTTTPRMDMRMELDSMQNTLAKAKELSRGTFFTQQPDIYYKKSNGPILLIRRPTYDLKMKAKLAKQKLAKNRQEESKDNVSEVQHDGRVSSKYNPYDGRDRTAVHSTTPYDEQDDPRAQEEKLLSDWMNKDKYKNLRFDYFSDLLRWHSDILDMDTVTTYSKDDDDANDEEITTPCMVKLKSEQRENNLTNDMMQPTPSDEENDDDTKFITRNAGLNDQALTNNDIVVKGEAKYFQYNKSNGTYANHLLDLLVSKSHHRSSMSKTSRSTHKILTSIAPKSKSTHKNLTSNAPKSTIPIGIFITWPIKWCPHSTDKSATTQSPGLSEFISIGDDEVFESVTGRPENWTGQWLYNWSGDWPALWQGKQFVTPVAESSTEEPIYWEREPTKWKAEDNVEQLSLEDSPDWPWFRAIWGYKVPAWNANMEITVTTETPTTLIPYLRPFYTPPEEIEMVKTQTLSDAEWQSIWLEEKPVSQFSENLEFVTRTADLSLTERLALDEWENLNSLGNSQRILTKFPATLNYKGLMNEINTRGSPAYMLDTTLMAYDDEVQTVTQWMDVKKMSRNLDKPTTTKEKAKLVSHPPITKINKQPAQYYTTPLPMKSEDFEKFLKDKGMDPQTVTSPLYDKPVSMNNWLPKKKPNTMSTKKLMTLNTKPQSGNPKKTNVEISNSTRHTKVKQIKHGVTSTTTDFIDQDLDLVKRDTKGEKPKRFKVNINRIKRLSNGQYNYKNNSPRKEQKSKNYEKLLKMMRRDGPLSTDEESATYAVKLPVENNPWLHGAHNTEVDLSFFNIDNVSKLDKENILKEDKTLKEGSDFKSNEELLDTEASVPAEYNEGYSEVTTVKFSTKKSIKAPDSLHNKLLYDKLLKDIDTTTPKCKTKTFSTNTAPFHEPTTKAIAESPHLVNLHHNLLNKLQKNPNRIQISSHHYKYDIYYDPEKNSHKENIEHIQGKTKFKEPATSGFNVDEFMRLNYKKPTYTSKSIAILKPGPKATRDSPLEAPKSKSPPGRGSAPEEERGFIIKITTPKKSKISPKPNNTEAKPEEQNDEEYDVIEALSGRSRYGVKDLSNQCAYQPGNFDTENGPLGNEKNYDFDVAKAFSANEKSAKVLADSQHSIYKSPGYAYTYDNFVSKQTTKHRHFKRSTNIKRDTTGTTAKVKEDAQAGNSTFLATLKKALDSMFDWHGHEVPSDEEPPIYESQPLPYFSTPSGQSFENLSEQSKKKKKLKNEGNIDQSKYLSTTSNLLNNSYSMEYMKNKRSVEPSDTYTAKDVAALEVIVDLVKNTLSYEDRDIGVFKKSLIMEQGAKSTQQLPDAHGSTNSIQVHIAIPFDIQYLGKKRSVLDPVRVRKVFSAKMSSPVDLEYQVHSFEDSYETPATFATSDDGLSPGMYLLVDNPKNGYALKPVKANIDLTDLRIQQASTFLPIDLKEETTRRDDIKTISRVTLSKDFIAAINKQLVELYENLTKVNTEPNFRKKRQINYYVTTAMTPTNTPFISNVLTGLMEHKIHRVNRSINWDVVKQYLGHDRVCSCKCAENKTICKACAVSDAVMDELIFELDNLRQYMRDHCTEIQTYFWMNPTGGLKLREAVHRIDKSLHDYYRRVKGKCKGRTCQALKACIDKREFVKSTRAYNENVVTHLLNDLWAVAEDLNKTLAMQACYNHTLKERGDKMMHAFNTCTSQKSREKRSNSVTKRMQVKNVYSLDNINVNIICHPEEESAENYEPIVLKLTSPKPYELDNLSELGFDYNPENNKKRKGFRLFERRTRKDKMFTYYTLPDYNYHKTPLKRDTRNQMELPVVSDGVATYWFDYKNAASTFEPHQEKQSKESNVTPKPDIGQNKSPDSESVPNAETEVTIDYLTHNINQLLHLFGNLQDIENMNMRLNQSTMLLTSTTKQTVVMKPGKPPNRSKGSSENNSREAQSAFAETQTTNLVTITTSPKDLLIGTKSLANKLEDLERTIAVISESERRMDYTPELTPELTPEDVKSTTKMYDTNQEISDNTKTKAAQSSSTTPTTIITTVVNIQEPRSKPKSTTLKSNTNSTPQRHTVVPLTTQVHITKPQTSKPQTSKHQTSKHQTSKHQTSKPQRTKPQTTKLHTTSTTATTRTSDSLLGQLQSVTLRWLGFKKPKWIGNSKPTKSRRRSLFKAFAGNKRNSNINNPEYNKRPDNFTLDSPTIFIINSGDNPKAGDIPNKRMKDSEACKNLLLTIIQFETNRLNDEWQNVAYGSERDNDSNKRSVNIMARSKTTTTTKLAPANQENPNTKTIEEKDKNDPLNYTDLQPSDSEPIKCKNKQGLLNKIVNKFSMKVVNTANKKKEQAVKKSYLRAVKRKAKAVAVKREKDIDTPEASNTYTPGNSVCDLQATFNRAKQLHKELVEKKFEAYVKQIPCYKYRRLKKSFFVNYRSGGMKWDWIRNKRSLAHFAKSRSCDENSYDDEQNCEVFETFKKGDDDIYRLMSRHKRSVMRRVSNTQLTNLPPLKLAENELYVMLGDSTTLDCKPPSPRDADAQPQYAWMANRNEMLDHDNVHVQGPKLMIWKAGPKNGGTYRCILDNSVRRIITVNIVTLPAFDVVFLPTYRIRNECTYEDLRAFQHLGRNMAKQAGCGNVCTIRIDEPMCQRDRATNRSMIRSTGVLTMAPLYLKCSVQCRRDLLSSLVRLAASNVPALTDHDVVISKDGVNETLKPYRDVSRPMITHMLRKKDSSGHHEYHKLSALLKPGRIQVVVICHAGYYFILNQRICVPCPSNTSSSIGDNTCTPCPQGTVSEPGASKCHDVDKRQRRYDWWWYPPCGYVAAGTVLVCACGLCMALALLVHMLSRGGDSRTDRMSCVSRERSPKKQAHVACRGYAHTSRARPLSPSRVILARFFKPSLTSSRGTVADSQETRFELWKERNIAPPLPPIDFDLDS